MRGIFITGTDTGIGKTLVTGLTSRYLSRKGYKIINQKWIETGARKPAHSIYTFKFPSSPHLAARLENRIINKDRIKRSFLNIKKRFDVVLVEGIGGALVPYNKKSLVIDIAKELNIPVLIVAGNKLGAINHTLLTVEAIKRRGLEIVGIVFNNINKKTSNTILKDNVKIIKKLSGEPILGILPYRKDKKTLYSAFLPIGKKIYEYLD